MKCLKSQKFFCLMMALFLITTFVFEKSTPFLTQTQTLAPKTTLQSQTFSLLKEVQLTSTFIPFYLINPLPSNHDVLLASLSLYPTLLYLGLFGLIYIATKNHQIYVDHWNSLFHSKPNPDVNTKEISAFLKIILYVLLPLLLSLFVIFAVVLICLIIIGKLTRFVLQPFPLIYKTVKELDVSFISDFFQSQSLKIQSKRTEPLPFFENLIHTDYLTDKMKDPISPFNWLEETDQTLWKKYKKNIFKISVYSVLGEKNEAAIWFHIKDVTFTFNDLISATDATILLKHSIQIKEHLLGLHLLIVYYGLKKENPKPEFESLKTTLKLLKELKEDAKRFENFKPDPFLHNTLPSLLQNIEKKLIKQHNLKRLETAFLAVDSAI